MSFADVSEFSFSSQLELEVSDAIMKADKPGPVQNSCIDLINLKN